MWRLAIGERPHYLHQFEGLRDVTRTILVSPKQQLFRLLTLKMKYLGKVQNAIGNGTQCEKIRIVLQLCRFYVKSFFVNWKPIYMNIILTTLEIADIRNWKIVVIAEILCTQSTFFQKVTWNQRIFLPNYSTICFHERFFKWCFGFFPHYVCISTKIA